MWVQLAHFDAKGQLQSKTNLTEPDDGIGYLVFHPDGQSMLFATENARGDVETYYLPLNGSKPTQLLKDVQELYAPCASLKPPCVDASTFHATYLPDGKRIIFAYRVWDEYGVCTCACCVRACVRTLACAHARTRA